jgi:DNA-binding MarR family transcriptional regulator
MNQRYEFLQGLIDLVDRYETENGEQKLDLLSFTLWLNSLLSRQERQISKRKEKVTDVNSVLGYEYTMEAKISTLLTNLFKYAKHYTKFALEDSSLTTLDDFGFLASLGYNENMTKTGLSNHNLLEITSGNEIIKRLLKSGFIEEYDDPDDRRSKRLKITTSGVKVLQDAFKKMDKVSTIVAADLNTEEKIQLLNILNKMDDFHRKIHEKDWKSGLDEINQKYLDT